MKQQRLNELQCVHPDLVECTCNGHLTPLGPSTQTEQLQALQARTAQQEEGNCMAGEAGIL